MENAETRHQLIAIRMQWLNWLAKPIVAIWNFIVDSLTYIWDIVMIAWNGMKESLNYRYWLIAGVGGTGTALILILFAVLAIRTDMEEFATIGAILSILPMAWTFAETASLVKLRRDSDAEPDYKAIRANLGKGLRAITFFALYVATIIVMFLIQVVLDLFGLIPAVGPMFLGLFLLPLFGASLIAIFSGLIITFGTSLLGPHLLTEEPGSAKFMKRYWDMSVSLIRVIGKKWLDLIILSGPVGLFGIIMMILPAALAGAAITLSIGIARGVADYNLQSLIQFFDVYGNPGFFDYIGGFFLIISLSVIAGAVFSFYLAVLGCAYNGLYEYSSDRGLFKKLSGIVLLIVIITIIILPLLEVFGIYL